MQEQRCAVGRGEDGGMEGGRQAAAVGGGQGGRMRSAIQCNAPMPPLDTAAPSPAARAAP